MRAKHHELQPLYIVPMKRVYSSIEVPVNAPLRRWRLSAEKDGRQMIINTNPERTSVTVYPFCIAA